MGVVEVELNDIVEVRAKSGFLCELGELADLGSEVDGDDGGNGGGLHLKVNEVNGEEGLNVNLNSLSKCLSETFSFGLMVFD